MGRLLEDRTGSGRDLVEIEVVVDDGNVITSEPDIKFHRVGAELERPLKRRVCVLWRVRVRSAPMRNDPEWPRARDAVDGRYPASRRSANARASDASAASTVAADSRGV